MFWSKKNHSDQNTSQTIISNAQIKKLQFYQFLGIPLPSLILGLIGLKICFISRCGLMAIYGFPLWKLISVWSISAGSLAIYSIDFIWDSRGWKLKGIPIPRMWSRIAWGWLVFSLILWISLGALILDFLGGRTFFRLALLLIENPRVQFLLLGLFMYGLIISILKHLKWLMVIILPWVVAMSLTFPIYSFKDFSFIISNGQAINEFESYQAVAQNHLFPWSIFALLSMNVLLVQFFERPKDQTLGNYNIWIRMPQLARSFWIVAVIMFLLMSVWNLTQPFYEVTWGEWLIVIAYNGLLYLGYLKHESWYTDEAFKRRGWENASKATNKNPITTMLNWLSNSGYRFIVDLFLLGMILK